MIQSILPSSYNWYRHSLHRYIIRWYQQYMSTTIGMIDFLIRTQHNDLISTQISIPKGRQTTHFSNTIFIFFLTNNHRMPNPINRVRGHHNIPANFGTTSANRRAFRTKIFDFFSFFEKKSHYFPIPLIPPKLGTGIITTSP